MIYMTDPFGEMLDLPGLVTSCIELYSLAVTPRRFCFTGTLMVTRTAIEQAKFQVWLETVGFDYPRNFTTFRLRIQLHKIVRETLGRIKSRSAYIALVLSANAPANSNSRKSQTGNR